MEHKKTSSNNFLSLCFALASILLMIILKIVVNFGEINFVFTGIFTIFILALPVVGGILSYLKNKDLKSLEMIVNAATLVLALIVL